MDIKPSIKSGCRRVRKDDQSLIQLERRPARRFCIRWDVLIKGTDEAGFILDEAGELENLSSSGAAFYLARALKLGTKLKVRLRVPFRKENWMIYSGAVVHIQSAKLMFRVAVKFDTPRPAFTEE
jgi:hypothetical protein